MFFPKATINPIFNPVIVRDELVLRTATVTDHRQWTDLREQSRAHLIEWEQEWTPDQLSLSSYKRRLRIYDRDHRRGGGLYLLAFHRTEDTLVGGVTLSNIRYGAIRSGIVGYWVGVPYLRRGYGSQMIAALVQHGFDKIDLNRIEAACQPENIASQKLLARSGFTKEGLARDYLKINDHWCDHEIYAMTASDYRQQPAD